MTKISSVLFYLKYQKISKKANSVKEKEIYKYIYNDIIRLNNQESYKKLKLKDFNNIDYFVKGLLRNNIKFDVTHLVELYFDNLDEKNITSLLYKLDHNTVVNILLEKIAQTTKFQYMDSYKKNYVVLNSLDFVYRLLKKSENYETLDPMILRNLLQIQLQYNESNIEYKVFDIINFLFTKNIEILKDIFTLKTLISLDGLYEKMGDSSLCDIFLKIRIPKDKDFVITYDIFDYFLSKGKFEELDLLIRNHVIIEDGETADVYHSFILGLVYRKEFDKISRESMKIFEFCKKHYAVEMVDHDSVFDILYNTYEEVTHLFVIGKFLKDEGFIDSRWKSFCGYLNISILECLKYNYAIIFNRDSILLNSKGNSFYNLVGRYINRYNARITKRVYRMIKENQSVNILYALKKIFKNFDKSTDERVANIIDKIENSMERIKIKDFVYSRDVGVEFSLFYDNMFNMGYSEKKIMNMIENTIVNETQYVFVYHTNLMIKELLIRDDRELTKDFFGNNYSDVREFHDFLSKYILKLKNVPFDLNQDEIEELDGMVILKDKMRITVPKTNHDVIDAGSVLNICVGMSHFSLSVKEKKKNIIFIEDFDNNLLYCLDFNVLDGKIKIREFKGKRNSIPPLEITKIINNISLSI